MLCTAWDVHRINICSFYQMVIIFRVKSQLLCDNDQSVFNSEINCFGKCICLYQTIFFFSWLIWSQIFQKQFYGYINFVMIGIVCWLDFVSFLLFLHKLWTCKDKDCARNDVTKLGFNKRSLSLLLIFIYDDRWRHFGTECNLTPQNSLSASTSFNSGLRSICPRVKSPISDHVS